MKKTIHAILFIGMLFLCATGFAQKAGNYDAIYSGVPIVDTKGKVMSAHGANIIKDGALYYLFGEKHSDTSNVFVGFTCYSSKDLYTWKFESIALPIQPFGKLGPKRVGERVKVMKCPKSGEYVMYMHVDTVSYNDQFVGYATSRSITGPYKFQGPLLFKGQPVRKWDMGAFQDNDGSGYVLIHGGSIYKLSDDYKSIVEEVNGNMTAGFESPAIFHKNNIYFLLGSNLTSWERNDNYYYTATSLHGPWTKQGLFCPPGTLTWNSQTSFVLPIIGAKDTTFMYMGDRWSSPHQESAATYVWQPLTISGTSLSIPIFQDAWQTTANGIAAPVKISGKIIENTDQKEIQYSGNWKHTNDSLSLSSSDAKDDRFAIKFTGRQAALYGLSRPDGGYARVELKDAAGKVLHSCLIDNYCKYAIASLKYITPLLPKGSYTLTVTVSGEHGNWSDKKKNVYGSTGNTVSLNRVIVKQ